MNNFSEGFFYNPSQGNLRFNQMIGEILNYINEKPEKFYDIIVGCDSSSGQEPNFPLAVVILRKGEGGRFFLKKINYKNRRFYNWKTRVLEEVLLSCELALYLKENLSKKLKTISEPIDYQFRYIHADIGKNGLTREMIKEITGLIKGSGFEPKIKPEAFAAATVADRFS
ncbi:MAG: ribonuclease H-like YkuK family protein [Candidatus Nealsonbacteria bacterium]|nr:ribonuclease H-like YkuK family protein [Candidatus Nealsonbacteria bacterium]